MSKVLLNIDARGVATATVNRPEIGNAYDEEMLGQLANGLDQLAGNAAVRALVTGYSSATDGSQAESAITLFSTSGFVERVKALT